MSQRHPIIAVTGSSGAGTTTVMNSFANIFRREHVKAQVIEGDSFQRFNRVEMRERTRVAELERQSEPVATSGRTRTCSPSWSRPSVRTARAARGQRAQVRARRPARPRSSASRAGTFTDWQHDGRRHRRAVLRRPAWRLRRCGRRRRRAPRRPAGRRGADRQPRMDPEAAPRSKSARLLAAGGRPHDPAAHARLREPHRARSSAARTSTSSACRRSTPAIRSSPRTFRAPTRAWS